MPSLTFRNARTAFVPAIAIVTLLSLGADTVLGGTELSRSGKVGVYSLNDSVNNRVVTCYYDSPNELQSFVVWPPTVYARDRTAARDSGKVGWQIIIKRWKARAPAWETFFTTGIRTAKAWDDTAATFTTRQLFPTIPRNESRPSNYYVVEKIFWYAADGSVVGTALARVDYLEKSNGYTAPQPVSRCNRLYS